MLAAFFPVKKLRRNGKYVVFGAVLLLGLAAVYHEMVASKRGSDYTRMSFDDAVSSWRSAMFDERVKAVHGKEMDRSDHQPVDSDRRRSNYTPQTWKPEYKGLANLHVFEDWCGGSTADLRRNNHYPLYPHSRTTVHKLAVSPQWTNYGLRIFGYLHPYTDGEFVFALSSDDNSEFWLSTDDSPLNIQLLAWVGKTGTEWTAPGEFEKYASQSSKPVRLSAQRRYFFEVIHKQNDRGTDHIEVAWKLLDRGLRFKVIDSAHISLFVNESGLLAGDVAHIPETAASRHRTPTKQPNAAADMLRDDPRDNLYQMPLINSEFLRGVLPDCSYKPSYTIRGFRLTRYQGLNFVQLSYIYPNDYTRLTHMEAENTCFYPENPSHMKMFGFSRYLKLDHPDLKDIKNLGRAALWRTEAPGLDYETYRREKKAKLDQVDKLFQDHGDDYGDYTQKSRRKLFSLVMQETNNMLTSDSDATLHADESRGKDPQKPAEHLQPPQTSTRHPSLQQNQTESKLQARVKKQIKPRRKLRPAKKLKSVDPAVKAVEQLTAKERPAVLSKRHRMQRYRDMNQTQIQRLKPLERDPPLPEKPKQQEFVMREMEHQPATTKRFPSAKRDMMHFGERLNQWDIDANHLWSKMRKMNEPPQEVDYFNENDEPIPEVEYDTKVNWNQTFHGSHLDLQAQRSDAIDLRCNVSGNLLLHSTDALPIVTAFMEQLNKKHNGQFTLVRVINVAKRSDGLQGSRYLLELEVKDVNGQLLRLSHYIYNLTRNRRRRSEDFVLQNQKAQPVLCNPVGFRWNPAATVHFIIPVKNQARWVQQLITDMENLFRETRDDNFNVIITDYNSTDMDVRTALEKSSLPRYQYVKLSGNFERSAGLQAGVDLINDSHSIVFLCDLHIHFPPFIIDTIRKNCVEGHMVFTPIVMRLDCGATPLDARGYWEVNGFGLMGIYKSDLVSVGGMNTREYKDRWGGEDWELLDRILEGGLEVKRVYMRKFFHYYHSKRGMWNRRLSAGHR